MPVDVVVDTNVFKHASECEDNSKKTSCLHVVTRLLDDNSQYAVALDYKNKILDEYKKNLSKNKGLAQEVFIQAIEKHAYSSDSDKFTRRFPVDKDEVAHLIRDGFHDNDLIFVRISPNTESNSIISSDEESIADEDYKEWIEDELEVTVCIPEAAIEEIFN